MLDQGIEPQIAEMTAYFPVVIHGIPITTKRISSDADVAVAMGNVAGLGIRHIARADDRHATVGGSPVVLLAIPQAWMRFWPGLAQPLSRRSQLRRRVIRSR